jgi:SAM-dependent methyltransferase
MNTAEYATMFRVEDRHWWYGGLRGMLRLHWQRYRQPGWTRLLDVGCGTGATLAMFAGEADAWGLDAAPEAVAFCRERGLGATLVGSATELPYAQASFDAVISCDVLCHRSIDDPAGCIGEMMRVLRPGGVVFLNLPAYQWLMSSHDRAVHTVRRFTAAGASRLVRRSGLEPLRVTYWNSLLFPVAAGTRMWRRAFPRAESDLAAGSGEGAGGLLGGVMAVERAIAARTPLPCGLSVFIAARKPG